MKVITLESNLPDTSEPSGAITKQGTLSFHKLPSGGRGEYELVGGQGDLLARDLTDRVFVLETPFGRKDTNIYLGKQGGKRRLRRLQANSSSMQIQRQLAALLMLPQSTRSEDAVSSALPVLLKNRYILDASIDLVSADQNEAVVKPTVITARSGDIHDNASKLALDASLRFLDLTALYDAINALPPGLSDLVKGHQRLVQEADTIGQPAEQSVSDLMDALGAMDVDYLPGTDPLPSLLRVAGLRKAEIEIPVPPSMPADDLEIKLRAEHILRERKIRGAGAAKFRREVQQAYDFRCAFCGLRAPASKGRAMPGVDAAHILPWGSYDLDVPQNGLILCKQHHWAFDSHVLTVNHANGKYFVQLADDAGDVVQGDPTTLQILRGAVGRITEERLPHVNLRPSPNFISELYSSVN